jgi:hypothetical protein
MVSWQLGVIAAYQQASDFLEGQIQFVADLIAHDPAHADRVWFAETFEPCRDVDAIT